MLILKDFTLLRHKNALQSFEGLFIGGIKVGYTTENIFKIKCQPPDLDYPVVLSHMFKFELKLGDHSPIIYGFSVEDCRNKAIEVVREFLMAVLR